MNITKVRDLTLVEIDNERTMVIACDSCGSIGLKEGDKLKVPPFYTGKYTARVCIMEVLSAGAEIVTVTDAVCCEMEPTGREIIKGIKEELNQAGIKDIVLTGSTEENFETSATGLGVTVIGIASSKELRINNIKNEALVISIGKPKIGGEINLIKDDEVVNYKIFKELLKLDFVYEIVPVGSKGIAYEAKQLALHNGFDFKAASNLNIDINKSAGPATCVIAAIEPDKVNVILQLGENINIIGSLIK